MRVRKRTPAFDARERIAEPMMLRRVAHILIRTYQLTLSSLVGSMCRHLPTCSHYTDEAIQMHGFWAGGWMGLARVCRCRPGGTAGFDPVPLQLPQDADWRTPWRYGQWRGPLRCDAPPPDPRGRI